MIEPQTKLYVEDLRWRLARVADAFKMDIARVTTSDVQMWLDGMKAAPRAAKKFSGKFVLRVEPALHRRLAAKALAAGESLNSYCVKTLVKA